MTATQKAVLACYPQAGAQFLKPLPDAPSQLARAGYWRIYQSIDQAPNTPDLGRGRTEAAAWADAAAGIAASLVS